MKCPYCGKEKFVTGKQGAAYAGITVSRNLRKLWHDCAVLCEKAGKIA